MTMTEAEKIEEIDYIRKSLIINQTGADRDGYDSYGFRISVSETARRILLIDDLREAICHEYDNPEGDRPIHEALGDFKAGRYCLIRVRVMLRAIENRTPVKDVDPTTYKRFMEEEKRPENRSRQIATMTLTEP